MEQCSLLYLQTCILLSLLYLLFSGRLLPAPCHSCLPTSTCKLPICTGRRGNFYTLETYDDASILSWREWRRRGKCNPCPLLPLYEREEEMERGKRKGETGRGKEGGRNSLYILSVYISHICVFTYFLYLFWLEKVGHWVGCF